MPISLSYLSSDDRKDLRDRSDVLLDTFFGKNAYTFHGSDSLLFFASGGTEQKAIEIAKNTKRVILLCHRESNAYAAALETATYLRSHDKMVALIDILSHTAQADFQQMGLVMKALKDLENQKAALIGQVSEWLVSSAIDASIIMKKLGIELLNLTWPEVGDHQQMDVSPGFLDGFSKTDHPKLGETAKVYSLLKKIIEDHRLSAITVECFPMVKRDQVTACLPLSVLNKQNIVAACEGDITSLIGMMIIKALTNSIPWQANVANITENSLLFAHCTAPLHLLESFEVTTHFETGVGTAIKGKFKTGKVGVFRLNDQLDRYVLFEGEIVNTPSHPFACRTQIELRTNPENIHVMKNKSLGNHHLIFPAEFVSLVAKMMDFLPAEKV